MDRKQAIIGVVPLWDEEKESYWMVPGYMEGIMEAGGVPLMLPLTRNQALLQSYVDMCGGFLLTGGQDVAPKLYNETPHKLCGESCTLRDDMEKMILDLALEKDKAVFGICRGIQFLNIYLGGSLYQDIPTQAPSDLEHHQTPPYDVPVHEVALIKGTPIAEWIQQDTLCVNSYHHQGIKNLASSLKVMAKAEDGLIEGVYMPDKRFVMAVQWHPEFSYKNDESSRILFQKFVEESIL